MSKIIARFPELGTAEYKRIFRRKDVGLIVPNNGKQYVQVLHDWLVRDDGMSRADKVGSDYAHPAIVNREWGLVTSYNGKVYDYVTLPEKWQWLIWEFCGWSVDYQLEVGRITDYYTKKTTDGLFARATPYSWMEYYISIVEFRRAWTESFSPEMGGRCFPTGRNPLNNPFAMLLRGCTGQLQEVTSNGTKWKVKALDITKDPPPFKDIISDPALYYWATEIRPERLADGTYTVSPFPQAKVPSRAMGLPFMGVAMPLLSMGGSYLIDKKACTPVLENGSSWSPYYPKVYN